MEISEQAPQSPHSIRFYGAIIGGIILFVLFNIGVYWYARYPHEVKNFFNISQREHSIVSEPTSTPIPTPTPLPLLCKGIYDFRIQTSGGKSPEFQKGTLTPCDPAIGSTQRLELTVASPKEPITDITATIRTDTKTATFPLKRISGTSTEGVYEGEWTMSESYDYVYTITLKASNNRESNQTQLTFK